MISNRNASESRKAIDKCKKRCVICGYNAVSPEGAPLVQGCHVKEYSKDKTADLCENIIALCPNHHVELDSNNFYIDSKTRKLVCFDGSNPFNGKYIEIDYIKSEYLAYRQYHVLEYWNRLNKQ